MSNPANPTRIGGITTTGPNLVYGVSVVGNYAYLAEYLGGLQVIDVSNPSKPLLLGRIDTLGNPIAVQVVGNRAFVVAGESSLEILEVKVGFPQKLESHVPTDAVFQDPTAVPAVTATSGLPVTLSVVSGPATVTDNQLTWTGLGPVTLRAEQAGADLFFPASAQWTVNVIPRRLGARPVGGQLELFWATGFAGLQLQGRSSLSPDSPCQDVTTAPVEADGEARVRLDGSTPLRFFRLLKP